MAGHGAKSTLSKFFRSLKPPRTPRHEDTVPNDVAEIHEGPCEVNGIARPSELHDMPRSELHWTPRMVELDAASVR